MKGPLLNMLETIKHLRDGRRSPSRQTLRMTKCHERENLEDGGES